MDEQNEEFWHEASAMGPWGWLLGFALSGLLLWMVFALARPIGG